MMKSKVLELLINSDGYISGSKIASELNVTRAAVWKHIKSLRETGYDIKSFSSKGYKLVNYSKAFNKYELELLIKKLGLDLRVFHFDTIDSTNTYAKNIDGENALIVANEQTNGRGRLGREWSSKKGRGVYFSLMLRLELPPHIVGMITQISAVALREAISDTAMIKWPNDIFIGDKKIAGILTELVTEIDVVEKMIIGIGLNINEVSDYKDIATSIVEEKIEFNHLDFFSKFLSRFFDLLNTFVELRNLAFIRGEIEKYSYFMNKEVYITRSDKEYIFRGITDYGNAILESTNGELEEVFFGEMSLKRR